MISKEEKRIKFRHWWQNVRDVEKYKSAKSRYRRKNNKKIRAKEKEWRAKNKDRVYASMNKKNKERLENRECRARYLLYATKYRAKKRGLEFSLSIEDLKMVDLCPLLGCELDWISSKTNERTPSIDRIDNDLGYVAGNVWLISHKANRMKNSATIQELVQFSKNVLEAFNDRR